MKWRKISITTTEEAEDLVAAMLDELGFEGVLIEDKAPVDPAANGGLFGDVLPDLPEDDHLAVVSSFIEDTPDRSPEEEKEMLARIEEELASMRAFCDIGEGRVSVSETEDKDWINNWKNYFHAFSVDDIRIIPTWEEEEVPEAEKTASMILRIDPGTAFGTGKHETTQLAIRQIRKYMKDGDTMLDIGTGSGILGIIALKSGASFVYGTDIDEMAFPALEKNLADNGIDDACFVRVQRDLITDAAAVTEAAAAVGKDGKEGRYDIVVSNIIAEILAKLTPIVPGLLRDGGIYITSGILREKESIVREACEKAGLTVKETTYQGDWCSVTAVKES